MSSSALTAEGRISTTGDSVLLAVAGYAGAALQIADTFTGTVSFTGTVDGQTYVPIVGAPVGGAAAASSATAPGVWIFGIAGLLAIRVIGSGWATGAARITLRATDAAGASGGSGGSVSAAVTIVDGGDTTEGTIADAAVTGDNPGTVNAHLRGITKTMAAGTFLTPQTSGGLLVAQMTSADGSTPLTNVAQAIKATAGQLFGWYIYNPNAAAIFIPIYNIAAASVVVGTTNPQMTLCIPATAGANLIGDLGIAFTNAGWSAAATTTGGGNVAPTTALEVTFFYK